jgi:hypothetical protein
MESDPTPEVVATRLKGQFAPAYLTLTSIIQGVAISTLVARIEATSSQFDAADWLLATATFLAFLLVWHEYLMQALAYVWMPTLLDSLVPFALLVAELFAAHFVYGNQRAWLLAVGVAFTVGVAAWGASFVQAQGHADENRGVLRAVGSLLWVRLTLTVALTVLYLGAWALYDVLRLGQVRLAVALVALLGIGVAVASTVPYWNRVLAHARGKRVEA